MSVVSNQTTFKSLSRSRSRLNKKTIHFHVKSFTCLNSSCLPGCWFSFSKSSGATGPSHLSVFDLSHLSGFAIANFSSRPALHLPLPLPRTSGCISHHSASYLLLPRRVVAPQSVCFAFLRPNAASLRKIKSFPADLKCRGLFVDSGRFQ